MRPRAAPPREPVVKTYALGVCYAEPPGSASAGGSFLFAGCATGPGEALVNAFEGDGCKGAATQRKWGAACFVGQDGGWGVGKFGAGNDFAVECGVTCG